jgi:hypothetical protein
MLRISVPLHISARQVTGYVNLILVSSEIKLNLNSHKSKFELYMFIESLITET